MMSQRSCQVAVRALATANIISTGCSSDNSVAPPTTGRLQIIVSGPTGGQAEITVTGPSGFHQVVTATTTLAPLAPGDYTITAMDVVVSNATYGVRSASTTVTVVASNTAATASVTYVLLSGALTLTVSGLPAGVLASVIVRGPGGFNHAATESQAFSNILAGSYLIFASQVSDGDTTYGPKQRVQQIEVLASLTVGTPATVVYSSHDFWTLKGGMPTPRGLAGAGIVNGMLYVVGGFFANPATNESYVLNTLAVYDPATNTWTTKTPMPTARYGLAVGVVNGVLFAVGGTRGTNGSFLSIVEAYDPATDSWTTKAPMPTARNGVAVGVVNGCLLAVGGANGAPLSTVEAYDPATNSWTTKAPMPTARVGMAVGVINGVLYAVGGTNGSALSSVEAYDPATNTWTTKPPMPTARYALAVGVVNGVLYAVGGIGDGLGGFANEAYDPLTDAWSSRDQLPRPTFGLAAGVVTPFLYAVGGQHGPFFWPYVEAYYP